LVSIELPCANSLNGSLKVSDREFEDLSGKVEDAFEFLKQYSDDLRSLTASSAKGSLDFAVSIPSQGFAARSFPAPLVSAVGALGLGLNFTSNPRDEDDAD
jgi:hypothetical protein